MHDIQRRRRRNQSEIDQLILEFQKSDLSPQEFGIRAVNPMVPTPA